MNDLTTPEADLKQAALDQQQAAETARRQADIHLEADPIHPLDELERLLKSLDVLAILCRTQQKFRDIKTPDAPPVLTFDVVQKLAVTTRESIERNLSALGQDDQITDVNEDIRVLLRTLSTLAVFESHNIARMGQPLVTTLDTIGEVVRLTLEGVSL